MIRKTFFWLLLIGLFASWAFADDLFPREVFTANSAKIIDGDTVVLDNRVFRLSGIDAPEYRQTCSDPRGDPWPCGKQARLHLVSLTASGSISCTASATDQYQRSIATCTSATVPDLGEAMVQAGLAVSENPRGTAAYETAQVSAKTARRGIWQGEFMTPGQWRTAHPRAGTPLP